MIDFDPIVRLWRSPGSFTNFQSLQTFGEQLKTLAQQHRNVCRDLERERVAGRHAQDNAEKLDQKLKALTESVVSTVAI